MTEKVLADVNCSLEFALGWCLSAKDTILFLNFPSVIYNKLPALEGRKSSKLIASHLNALHSARRRFIETEADKKLQCGLRYKTRTAISFQYLTRDQVYYKKDDSQYWKGPGAVIGYDNKQVFVRHGGIYLRVNPYNLQHVKETKEEVSQSEVVDNANNSENKENTTSEHDFEDSDTMFNLSNKRLGSRQESTTEENDVNQLTHMINQIDLHEDENIVRNLTKTTSVIPSVRSKITYEDPESNLCKKAMVMSRAGKASGKNKYWFNVKDLNDDSTKSEDFENINSWKNINEEVLISKVERFEITEAKLKELNNLKNNNVHQELDYDNQNKTSRRWVITEKVIDGTLKPKARLAAHGFEDLVINVVRKDLPTCGRENLRILFCISTSFG